MGEPRGCPFCGGRAVSMGRYGGAWQARCACGARGPRSATREDALLAWEDRVEPGQLSLFGEAGRAWETGQDDGRR